jgi:hypothetical protein
VNQAALVFGGIGGVLLLGVGGALASEYLARGSARAGGGAAPAGGEEGEGEGGRGRAVDSRPLLLARGAESAGVAEKIFGGRGDDLFAGPPPRVAGGVPRRGALQ